MSMLDRVIQWIQSDFARRRLEQQRRRAAKALPEIEARRRMIASVRMKHRKHKHLEKEQQACMTTILRGRAPQ